MGGFWGIRRFLSEFSFGFNVSYAMNLGVMWLIVLLNRVSKYIRSEAGREVQEKLWDETMVELREITTLPEELR